MHFEDFLNALAKAISTTTLENKCLLLTETKHKSDVQRLV